MKNNITLKNLNNLPKTINDLPYGLYRIKIIKVSSKRCQYRHGGIDFTIYVKVVDDDYLNCTLSYKGKLKNEYGFYGNDYANLVLSTTRPNDSKMSFDINDLVGKECEVFVDYKERGKKTKKFHILSSNFGQYTKCHTPWMSHYDH